MKAGYLLPIFTLDSISPLTKVGLIISRLEVTRLDIHRAFQHGAQILAKDNCKYTELHKGHGIDEHHWQMLTQAEYWSPDQTRQMRSILANVLEVSMTIAGMPAIPLPGQYVAALIAEVVAPANRLLACTKAPDTFDADAASGLLGTHEIKDMPFEQLASLVLVYSGGYPGEPQAHRLPRDVKETMKKENQK